MEKNSERQSDGGDACERGGLAMKTPDRNRIAAAAVSQFEDSPVFNYINSLSPIKTVKSLCTSQTFNSCSFSSLPSIFSSPHMSSLKDPRLLRRCYSSDSSKPEFSCQTENKVGHKEMVMDVAATEQPENFESCIEPTYECPELASQLSGSLNYDCRSPETHHRSELASTSGSQVAFLPEAGETGHLERTVLLEETRSTALNKEGIGSDWELISDAADFLIFESPNNAEAIFAPCQKLTDSITRFCTLVTQDDINNIQNTETVGPLEIEQSVHNHPSQSADNHHSGAVTSPNKYVIGETCEQADNELASSFQRGGRRRCLTFDMSGIHKRHLDHSSNSGSAMLSKSDATHETKSTQPIPIKPINSSSFRILPGIGLHLNAIARTSKESNVASHETIVNSQGGNKHVNVVEQNIGPNNSGAHSMEDACQTTFEDVAHDDNNNGSPRKKRPRVQNAGEPESCKRCNCKKSKCLKLYCECFAAGVYCVEPCSCQDCFNKPIHEDTVLATRKQIESRNPLAFAPKVIRSSDSIPETGDESNKTPASARHKRGCNCKKSGCLKKYCECYQGGVGCSINCRCEGCKNAFGTKDASILTEAEMEEENETCEKNAMERSLQKNVHPSGVERIQDTLPATPLRTARTLPDISFPSKSKPPRSSFLSIGSTTGFYGSQTFGKPNFLQPPMFEKRIQALHEAETPEILQGSSGLVGGVKSSSPNSKRVSPPHCSLGSSSSGGRKSSRKLILQSIPSFPSLTPKP